MTPHRPRPEAAHALGCSETLSRWPHTPSSEQLLQTVTIWNDMRDSMIGAAPTKAEIVNVTAHNGLQYPFDVAHDEPINVTPHTAYGAALHGLNDCLQAQRLYHDAADLFRRIDFHQRPDQPDTSHLTERQ